MEDSKTTVMENSNEEAKKKTGAITWVRGNWKTIVAVATGMTVAGVTGYKMGVSAGLNMSDVSDVVTKIVDGVEITDF